MDTVTTGSATVVKAVFNGLSTNGSIQIPGLNIGDVIVRCIPDGFVSGFEPAVTVAGQLQQSANLDWSSVQFTAYLLRGV